MTEWDRSQGHLSGVDLPSIKNAGRKEEEDALLFKWAGYGKRCRSKEGLAIHVIRMPDQEKSKMEFPCDLCGVDV